MSNAHTTCLTAVILLVAACTSSEPAPRKVDPAPPPAPDVEQAVEKETTKKPDKGPGRWRRFRRSRYKRALERAIEQEKEQLEAIGYLQGSTPAGDLIGVTRHDPKRAFQGLNLYTAGHEPAAFLIDMRGEVLHRWAKTFEEVWPGVEGPGDRRSRQFWRRVRLFENGDLLAIWDGHGLVRLDKDSRVIWKRLNGAHHDLDVAPNGDIYVLARESQLVARVDPRHPILEDFVLVLDPSGKEKRRVSLLEAFEKSKRYGHIWRRSRRKRGDVFHTNTVELLDGRFAHVHPALAQGNVLISIRFLDAIAVVDLDLGEVVWAATGTFKRQHEPTVLDNGNLLLFDNEGPGPDNFSVVSEYELPDMKPVWEYRGAREVPFYSHTCGAVQRLPNGNTLITESDGGRAFEVTRDKRIVWEYLNPHRAGERGKYIATLFDLVRLPPDFPIAWAGEKPD
jgi:hypothetical protein